MAYVANADLRVARAQSLASDRDPVRIQVATDQAAAVLAKGRVAESHAIAATASEIDDRPRAQVLGRKYSEYPVQAQLPPDEVAVGDRALFEYLSHQAQAATYSHIRGRFPMDQERGDQCANAADNQTQDEAT